VGVSFSPFLLFTLLPAIALMSLALSAVGVALVARMKTLDAGQYIFQFITFPIVMLSGAFFPLRNLPAWLNILTKINPLSYTVDMLRRITFTYENVPEVARTALSPTLFGRVPHLGTEILITFIFTLVLLFIAAGSFRKV
jgi:ABC-2 type transport system permease protein